MVELTRERGDIYEAMAILGLKKRMIEAMALRGELPGAAKISNRWTFDLNKLRAYVRDKVKRQGQWAQNRNHQQAVSGAAIPSTVGLALRANSSPGRFTQITQELRQGDARSAKNG
jgi:hypothetical protein